MALFEKNTWIRTVYLYLFALVGLALIIIGSVRLLDLGLKIFIFKEADKPEEVQRYYPPFPPERFLEPQAVSKDQKAPAIALSEKIKEFTETDRDALNRWLIDYQNWKESYDEIDYVRARREREASNSLAFIIIGLPLYLYHWKVIKRDRRERVE